MADKDIKKLYFYKKQNGDYVKYEYQIIVEDRKQIIISETPVGVALSHHVDEHGVQYHILPGGVKVINVIPLKEQNLHKLFTRFFGGDLSMCEGLEPIYEDYAKEVIDAGGENCKNCVLGDIRRKYIGKIRPLFDKLV
jgi:recombinational DNA repair protein RecR